MLGLMCGERSLNQKGGLLSFAFATYIANSKQDCSGNEAFDTMARLTLFGSSDATAPRFRYSINYIMYHLISNTLSVNHQKTERMSRPASQRLGVPQGPLEPLEPRQPRTQLYRRLRGLKTRTRNGPGSGRGWSLSGGWSCEVGSGGGTCLCLCV